jgi:hypothetical protein
MTDAPDENTGNRGGARDDSALMLGAGTPAPRTGCSETPCRSHPRSCGTNSREFVTDALEETTMAGSIETHDSGVVRHAPHISPCSVNPWDGFTTVD